ncbi:MAG: zeta toxin family protein [Bacteroidetes bacterium]|nr:zeta toxin family protein [Bacteroidota bacterium]MBS1631893.1 zeta toxin family protein [Bacteroidota bacterium]
MPDIFIIAGCNGAGKTTAAYNLLPDVFKTVEFVNADEIARGLSPLNPTGVAFQAGRIMLERIEHLIDENKSFSFETTLSGLSNLTIIRKAKERGYGITFFFIYLNNVSLAIERVAIRVSKGGHSIPEDIIKRRYDKGLHNFKAYASLADDWYIYDNSGSEYELLAKNVEGGEQIINFDLYNIIKGK